MGSENSKLNGNRMEVLGLVSIRPPSPWWWQGEDIDDVKAKGIIFRTFAEGEEEGSQDIAYLIVADVTGDTEELNVSLLNEDSVKNYDLYLHQGIKNQLPDKGMELIKWMSSELNEIEGLKILVTAYIVDDQGRERQNIALRMRVRGSNLVIMGCFDVDMKDQLAAPIFDAIRGFVILPSDAEV
jgi:hypothetical protein